MDTGLMYLCKTTSATKRNPYAYNGSGKYWLRHIKKHKPLIITCIVGEYNTKEELKENGIVLSEKWNVVQSEKWANLVPEQGDGGWIHNQTGNTWKIKDTSNMGHSNSWMHDDGSRKEIASKRMTTNNPSYNTPKTPKQLAASSKSSRIATEASKKKVICIDTLSNHEIVFESKRQLIKHLGISYDVLNYRLKTGILYKQYKFKEVK